MINWSINESMWCSLTQSIWYFIIHKISNAFALIDDKYLSLHFNAHEKKNTYTQNKSIERKNNAEKTR